MAVSTVQIENALRDVRDPDRGADIVSLGMVQGLQVSDAGEVIFMIEVDPQRGPALESLRQEAEKVAANVPGVGKVSAILTAEKQAAPQTSGQATGPHAAAINRPIVLPGVRHIIAVASGKGGVGKSTVSSCIASALANSGQKVGLLDADIYGPSQPRMMGVTKSKPEQNENDQIVPIDVHGIKLMSIGFMVAEESPLIWRGPMVQSAIVQLLRDVDWGDLDVLVIDMPPGTGDAQLTLSQKVPLSGAVIVSTPQDIALLDARKAIEMFRKVDVPILGIVENMSTHICSNCGHEDHIFGHGGARDEAEKLGVPFLGEVPLDRAIRENADHGNPSSDLEAFKSIASSLARFLNL